MEMKKASIVFLLNFTIQVFSYGFVKNTNKPLNGIVNLKVEIGLTIDPNDYENVVLKSTVMFSNSKNGDIILYDPNFTKAYLFDPKGTLKKDLIVIGQGPGEFPTMQGINVIFIGNEIWATGARKLAFFDQEGTFIDEKKLLNYPNKILDRDHYFVIRRMGMGKKNITNVSLLHDPGFGIIKQDELEFFLGKKLGPWTNSNGQFYFDSWGIPSLLFAYNPDTKLVYTGHSKQYHLIVKDIKGKTIQEISRDYKPVKVGMKEKRKLVNINEQGWNKWVLKDYPNQLNAIHNIQPMPGGNLGVFFISGFKKLSLDIFNPEGNYIYQVIIPEELNMTGAKFLSDGFATIIDTDDGYKYIEYQIKNLPDIFPQVIIKNNI